MKQSILKTSGYAGAANLVELILALLTAGLSIRFLGLEDAGFFLFFESLMQVNGGLFNLGFQSAVTKHAGQAIAECDEPLARRFFQVGMSFDLLLVALPCVIIVCLAPQIIEWSDYAGSTTTAVTYIYLACGALVLSKIQQVLTTGLMIRHAYGLLSSFRIASNILTNGLRIGVLIIAPSLPALGMTNAGVLAIGSTFLAVVFVRKNHYIPRFYFGKKELSQLWSFTKWEYVWSLCSMLTSNMDRILIVKYFGLAVLPIYSMAKRVLILGHRFISGFTDYLFPILAGKSDADRATMIQNMDYSLRWSLYGLAALLYGSAIILGPVLLNLVVGNDFGSRAQPYIIGFSLVGWIYLMDILPYHVARASARTYINTTIMLLSTTIVFSSIWFFASHGNLLMVVICQGFHLPVLILHNRWAMDYETMKQSAMRVFSPATGFLIASVFAIWIYILLEQTDLPSVLSALISAALLLSAVLIAIFAEYRFSSNDTIKITLDALFLKIQERRKV
ncbi:MULTISPECIES: lipopolysaccharide biosynthesis protein [unclassified Lentimonas]|uniref:lipopolysaccharide biosynthesis protein n=1 Tax=unclassified Lentimonas TaxID=2630993 RepID=UPI00132C791E|nr:MULTISPECIES: oligosaccharide flippase family protein [unclassified Lentimonas]CAA6696225.1 Unannotated [Lentimonas sp. CC10]CAA6697517.1 Unannotated [Lentimonas sp. CC19]CAA7071242.1 Unannotated [Lentimonas sp. CC11]